MQYLMSRLRDPETGCPWDLKQTPKSVIPYTLEEVYELVDAIEQDDPAQVRQELGDVLFQVIFYSQLASEQDTFRFSDVVNDIVEKLVRRHPHVFPDGTLESRRDVTAPDEADIKARWEDIKKKERAQKSQYSVLDDIPLALPALTRATKLQKRAAGMGFDWTELKEVVCALREELLELEEAIHTGERTSIADEMGDVLFSAVNLSRHLGLDAETTARHACAKFERRFKFVEQRCTDMNVSEKSEDATRQMALFWNEAKATGL
ncbi:nucleoside triphosphate pyrophosphohydrolase [Zhongshania aliphaticivorans]|uniref:nucleoside triphosphate pyrophosphohydrolase n=1 Tax=Zhongshania aliphaticivorans TaxID=1470434 RepID=UPI0022855160|nr:nucleoside triphosphate pyrophosphohydrolase [Zhongshania aliphaticivorans]